MAPGPTLAARQTTECSTTLGLLKKCGGGSSVFSEVGFNNSGTVTIVQGQIVVNGVALLP